MSTELSLVSKVNNPEAFVVGLGKSFAESQMFGCKTQAQGVVLALHCMMTNKSPLEIMQRYHLVEGKLSMRADAMLASFQQAGGEFDWNQTGENGVAELKLTRGEKTVVSRYTMDDAKKANLIKAGGGWDKSPANMLRARAASNGVRMIYPECVLGTYTPEEIEDMPAASATPPQVGGDAGDCTESQSPIVSQPEQRTGKAGRPRKAAVATSASQPTETIIDAEATPVSVAPVAPVAPAVAPTATVQADSAASIMSKSSDPVSEIAAMKAELIGLGRLTEAAWQATLTKLNVPTGPTDADRLRLITQQSVSRIHGWLNMNVIDARAKAVQPKTEPTKQPANQRQDEVPL